MNKKENQRMRLTKLLFKNALITLLQKKTIYQISVTELCDAAELNRSTFYKYYENVRDILTELEKETLQKSKQCMQEIAVGEDNFHIAPLYRLLCDMQNNREIYQLLLNNSANDGFPSDMMQETIEFLRDTAKSLDIIEEKSDYLFQYLVSGCISVVQNWINGEMKESPMEISELIYRTSVAVLKSAL
ncbi:MAG: TetR/AcrR family transcriptional regulator [Lachnospiraceae bacterium]|nr:TetR/AcrR family transcriptional regulator [Lachnospiraceae bacterium]